MNQVVSQYKPETRVLAPASVSSRYPLIDQLRGLAVVLMIIYHFAYNLTMYRYMAYDRLFEWPLFLTQRVCIITFLTCIGISLCMAHAKGMRWKSFWRRQVQVGAAALAVSLATWLTYAENWVYFGILHFITISSFVALPFIPYPKVALLIALALLVPYLGWDMTLPWIKLAHASFDYVPLFPWLAYVLLGIVAYHIGVHRWWHAPAVPPVKGLEFLGRHSLVIYLVHQPILMALVWLFYRATH